MFEESLMTGPELGPDPAAAVVSPHNGTLQRLPWLVPEEKTETLSISLTLCQWALYLLNLSYTDQLIYTLKIIFKINARFICTQ